MIGSAFCTHDKKAKQRKSRERVRNPSKSVYSAPLCKHATLKVIKCVLQICETKVN